MCENMPESHQNSNPKINSFALIAPFYCMQICFPFTYEFRHPTTTPRPARSVPSVIRKTVSISDRSWKASIICVWNFHASNCFDSLPQTNPICSSKANLCLFLVQFISSNNLMFFLETLFEGKIFVRRNCVFSSRRVATTKHSAILRHRVAGIIETNFNCKLHENCFESFISIERFRYPMGKWRLCNRLSGGWKWTWSPKISLPS